MYTLIEVSYQHLDLIKSIKKKKLYLAQECVENHIKFSYNVLIDALTNKM